MTSNLQSVQNIDLSIMNLDASKVEKRGDGTNWYIYCNNNPLNMVDPTGLDPHGMTTEEADVKGGLAIAEENANSYSEENKGHIKDEYVPEDSIGKPIIDILGNDAGVLGKNAETFSGVVGEGAYGSAGFFFSLAGEKGTAYESKDGIVTDSFNYISKSFGGMTNYGGEGGFVFTVIPNGEKNDFLGTSTTTGISGGAAGLGAGASWVKTSSGLDGFSFTKNVGWSQIPFTVSAYHDNVKEVK